MARCKAFVHVTQNLPHDTTKQGTSRNSTTDYIPSATSQGECGPSQSSFSTPCLMQADKLKKFGARISFSALPRSIFSGTNTVLQPWPSGCRLFPHGLFENVSPLPRRLAVSCRAVLPPLRFDPLRAVNVAMSAVFAQRRASMCSREAGHSLQDTGAMVTKLACPWTCHLLHTEMSRQVRQRHPSGLSESPLRVPCQFTACRTSLHCYRTSRSFSSIARACMTCTLCVSKKAGKRIGR